MEGDVWSEFAHDPRDPAVAPLRASDADREVVHRVLAEAFATGRLDRAEYDERTSAVMTARTLGQLPGFVDDLVPRLPARPASVPVPLSAMTAADIRRRAHESWLEDRRQALFGFLGPTFICWVIWLATNLENGLDLSEDFPWPLIVMAATLLNFLRVAASKQEIIRSEVARLERKQAKELRKRRDT